MGERADGSAGWIVRRAAKAAVAGALCAAGVRWVVRGAARRVAGGGRVLILSYHAVASDFARAARDVVPSLLVSAATLRRQLEDLARERDVISMDEACRRLAAPPRPRDATGDPERDAVTVTFDDGYASVHELALPVLSALRAPATVYVPTGYVGTPRRLLHDRLFAALRELHQLELPPQAAGLSARAQGLLDGAVGGGPGSTLDHLIARLPHDALVEVADALERRVGLAEGDLPDETRLMTWDELRALQAVGVAVGGHTVNHVALSNASRARARQEIRGCRDDIVAALGEAPRHFAYPNGYHTPAVRRLVAEHGFASAVTTEDTENRRGGDPFALKRKTMWENTTLGAVRYSAAVAACNLDGVFGALGWRHPVTGERPDRDEDDEAPAERAAG